MSQKTLLLYILLLTNSFSEAQSFNIEWQGCYGGSDTEYPYDICMVPGGYLIGGGTKSNDGDISYNHGATDCWLFKVDFSGNLLWEKTYGGSLGDGIFRIFSAGNNNYYLLCQANSSDGDISNDPYPDSGDFWILKVDSVGEIIWERIFGGNSDEQMWTGTPTDDGGVVALGWTASNDGDVSNYYGLYDGWMIKINSEGEKEWDFTLGTDGYDVSQAIIQTSDGGYLVGCASAIWDTGNITCEPYNENAEAVLVKLDSNLNIEWNQCYGGSEHDGATALVEVSDGYVFGGYAASNDGDILGWHGEADIWIVKVDFSGNIIWQKSLGGSLSEFTSKLAVSEDENIIIPGFTRSIDGDVSANHSVSEHEPDIWILELDTEGVLLWEHCFGGIWDEQLAFGFIRKGEGNYVFAGETDYGPSFDVGCTTLYDKNFWVFEVKDTLVGVQNNMVHPKEVEVFPNPAKNYVEFKVESFEFRVGEHICVYGVLGDEVARLEVKDGRAVWDCHEAINGIYFWQMYSEDKLYSGKIYIHK